MALFAELRAGWATRAGATRGGRGLPRKVNARRCAQPPETAGFARPNLPGMANKPLKTYGGLYQAP